jgi:hypothetical protein
MDSPRFPPICFNCSSSLSVTKVTSLFLRAASGVNGGRPSRAGGFELVDFLPNFVEETGPDIPCSSIALAEELAFTGKSAKNSQTTTSKTRQIHLDGRQEQKGGIGLAARRVP